ncbi:hypothetical protein BDB00DRAFT_541228 [Zychaea mexicana]|uniref:uncharacterized protein n=1 Tax=Zychaea mexicana TaxID=64656 RepID=UPI0022FE3DB5|nr:uncharacterized protein BDB00DRAFT_541228 [Zychaea mexicana]KAI9497814.1 hypothetical protein BDB00DRAFT_541228 [Zychaea mexicana]
MLSRRSLTWTTIVVFIVIIGLQTSSYFKLAISIQDDSIVPSDSTSEPVPPPSNSQGSVAHVTGYKRDYTTIWGYATSLLMIYSVYAALQRWCLRWRRDILSDRGIYCRFRRITDREFRILDSIWTLGEAAQVSTLVLLNSLFILRQRVLVQEEGGRDLFHQEYANRAAQLALVNISAAVCLSARHMHSTYRLGIDQTLAWHAWFARLGGLCTLYHACFQFARKYHLSNYHGMFDVLMSNARYITGTVMIAAISVLYIGSHPLVRAVSYRLFRVTHLLAFLTIVMLGVFHHWTFVVFYAAVACVWFVDQFKLSWPARLVSVKSLPSNIVRLQVEPSFPIEATDFSPGQFAFVSTTGRWLTQKLYSHPFSISRFDQEPASSLSSSNGSTLLSDKGGKAVFTFYIKANGRDTAALYHLAKSGDHACIKHMRMSKPLGRPFVDMAGRSYGDFEVVVLVAEGIGITPWISVMQQLGQRELHVITKYITLIWSVKSADTCEAFLPELQSHLTDIDYTINVYVTRDSVSDPENPLPSFSGLELTKGRPDHGTLLRDIHRKYPTTDTALGVCAHDETIQRCGNLARAFSTDQSVWAVRCERFEF